MADATITEADGQPLGAPCIYCVDFYGAGAEIAGDSIGFFDTLPEALEAGAAEVARVAAVPPEQRDPTFDWAVRFTLRPVPPLEGLPMNLPAETHLGDGVYASFDGFQFWLAVNHHENKVVALEPDILAALNAYAERVRQFYGQATAPEPEPEPKPNEFSTDLVAALRKRADWLRSEYLNGGDFAALHERELECRGLADKLEQGRLP